MVSRNFIQTAIVALSAFFIVSIAPVAFAQKADIGSIATKGTTVFSGDKVEVADTTLVNLKGGGRIEMTKASATFTQDGDTVVVRPTRGTFRFNFLKDEKVRILTDCFDLFAGKDVAVGTVAMKADDAAAKKNAETKYAVTMTSGLLTKDSDWDQVATTPEKPLRTVSRGGECVVPVAWTSWQSVAAASEIAAGVGIGIANARGGGGSVGDTGPDDDDGGAPNYPQEPQDVPDESPSSR